MKRLVVLALLLAACNPAGPDTPEISGLYRVSWLIRLTALDIGGSFSQTCSGTLNINQSGERFTGTYVIGAPCDITSGQIVNGTVGSGGAISFDLAGSPGGDAFVADALGCVPSSGTPITGIATGQSIAGSATAILNCGRNGRLQLNLNVNGTRG